MQGNVLDFERKFFEPKRGQIQKNGGIWVHQEVTCGKVSGALSQSDCVRMEEHFFRSSIVDCF